MGYLTALGYDVVYVTSTNTLTLTAVAKRPTSAWADTVIITVWKQAKQITRC